MVLFYQLQIDTRRTFESRVPYPALSGLTVLYLAHYTKQMMLKKCHEVTAVFTHRALAGHRRASAP
jgi:hypothetical protein